jgi:type IV pilus assembly protein PilW
MRGFSLVELMVALTIGLILVAGLMALVVGNIQGYSELSKSSYQVESARFSAQVLRDELSMAGYYGDLSFNSVTGSAALPSDDDIDEATKEKVAARYGVFIEGKNNVSAGESRYALKTSVSFKAGTDVLLVRRASSQAVLPGSMSGDYLYVGGDHATVQFMTSTEDRAPYTFLSDARFERVRRYIERLIYVSPCSVCSGDEVDSFPTLKMVELRNGSWSDPIPVVEGVDDLQLEYGLDNDEDGYPDEFVDEPATDEWRNVVSARFHLLVRSLEESRTDNAPDKTYVLGSKTVAPTDDFKRHVYSMTVRLRNAAERREDDDV